MGWDIDVDFDPEGNGWAERVHSTIPRIEEDEMVLLRRLEEKVDVAMSLETTDLRRSNDNRNGTVGHEVTTEAEESGGG
jgi:hypothetical protein